MDVARKIKEQFSYVCQDVVKEFDKYDQGGNFKTFKATHSLTKQVCSANINSRNTKWMWAMRDF